jgi:ATP-dependent DNA ligase
LRLLSREFSRLAARHLRAYSLRFSGSFSGIQPPERRQARFRGIVATPRPGGERLFDRMLARRVRTDGFVDPCIPSRALKPPSGPDWVHEVKHDGYRLIVRRDGVTVRLFSAEAMTGPTAIPPSLRLRPS